MKKIIIGLLLIGFPATYDAVVIDLNADEVVVSIPGEVIQSETTEPTKPTEPAEPTEPPISEEPTPQKQDPQVPTPPMNTPNQPTVGLPQQPVAGNNVIDNQPSLPYQTEPAERPAQLPSEEDDETIPTEPTEPATVPDVEEPQEKTLAPYKKTKIAATHLPKVIHTEKNTILPPNDQPDSEYLGKLMATVAKTINA